MYTRCKDLFYCIGNQCFLVGYRWTVKELCGSILFQWRSLWSALSVPSGNTYPLFNKLNILSSYNTNILQLCPFIYKYTYVPDMLPKPLNGFFQVNSQIQQNTTQDTAITFILSTSTPHIVNYLSDTEVSYSQISIFTMPKLHHPSITSSVHRGSAWWIKLPSSLLHVA